MHAQTAMRTERIAEQVRLRPRVTAEAGEGSPGLVSEFPDQVSAPPRKPKNPGEAAITEQYRWRQAKRSQSSRRIVAGHANGELRQWRPWPRWTGRRQDYAETHGAIAAWSLTASPNQPPAIGPAPNWCPPSHRLLAGKQDSWSRAEPRYWVAEEGPILTNRRGRDVKLPRVADLLAESKWNMAGCGVGVMYVARLTNVPPFQP
jgi:hypothetical protein